MPRLNFLVARLVLAATFALAFVPARVVAQEYGPSPDAATQKEVLALREKAWRTWFANDQAGFQQTVPRELVALGWDGGAWEDRKATLAGMAAFARNGMKLTTLEFPKNVMQQYGDVIILYTAFRLELKAPDGATSEMKGRGTEIFVKRDGKWIHTGWHLDNVTQ